MTTPQKIGTMNIMKQQTTMKNSARKTLYPSSRMLVFTDTDTKKTIKRYNTSRQYNY